jgi:hypothetical protein
MRGSYFEIKILRRALCGDGTLALGLHHYAIDVSGRETQIDEAVNQHDSSRFLPSSHYSYILGS